MAIGDMHKAKEFTARILAGSDAQFTVTPYVKKDGGMYLIPKMLVVGMGCRRGKSFDKLYVFLKEILDINNYDIRSVKALVSVDKKKDEEGLIKLSEYLNIPFVTFLPEVLMEQAGDFDHSDMVMKTIGADNVCERAVKAYGCRQLALKKTTRDGMTIALGLTDVDIVF
jgi:cobalt-precorrin 5A hydrolase